MNERYQLLLGDSRDIVPTLERASVDCIICDPPYGDTSLVWDVRLDAWLSMLAQVLKPTGSLWCFGSLRFFMALTGQLSKWQMAQDVVWEKHNGSSFHADRFKRVHEHIVQFYLRTAQWADVYKQPVYTTSDARRRTIRRRRPTHTGHTDAPAYQSEEGGPRLMRSVLYAASCHGYAIHPTQKPVEIIVPLLRYSCPPGGLVLDPFAGSASAGVAALQEGRRYLGIECSEQYHAAAMRRLAAVAAQGVLFSTEEAT